MEGQTTLEFADFVARIAIAHKALDLSLMDMSEVINYADVFLVCSGANRRQSRAIADQIALTVKRELGRLPIGVEGLEAGRWVLVDYGDVVIHVFDQPLRSFYDLDRLWRDAKPLPLPEGVEVEREEWEEEEV